MLLAVRLLSSRRIWKRLRHQADINVAAGEPRFSTQPGRSGHKDGRKRRKILEMSTVFRLTGPALMGGNE
jgi:hypothetical protein